MGTKGIVHMGFNYTLSEQISKIFASESPANELDTLGWVWENSSENIFNNIILESPQAPLQPQKQTILHHFIAHFLWAYLDYWNYDYIDQCFPSEDPDGYREHLSDLAKILLEYGQEPPNYEPILETIILADEQDEHICIQLDDSEEVKEYDVKEIFVELIDSFMERISNIEEEIANSTFFLLFKDKDFLFNFNLFLSDYIQKLDQSYFDDHGGVKRCSYIPQWLKTAIMFRDNGCCQICGKNLTGVFDSLEPYDLHYDHVIPLSKFGTNDPVNFQILCQSCNEKKGDSIYKPQYRYMLPWSM